MSSPSLSLRFRFVTAHLKKVWRTGGSLEADDQELRQHAEHLSARIPMLYLIFAINALLIAITFAGTVGSIQAGLGPAFFIVICISRARYWSRRKVHSRTNETLRADIRRLQIVGPAIVVFAIAWIMSLYPSASPAQQGVIYYVIGLTTVSGILTLIDTPRTAILGGAASLIPFSIVLLAAGDPNATLIAFCHMLVTVLLIGIGVRYYRDLEQLLNSKRQLRQRQVAIEKNAAELEVLSLTDPLTGSLNRRAILSKAAEKIADVSKPSPWLALLDLDGFKEINDSFGHVAGDHALQIIAERIGKVDGITDFGRIGGDEFAILISGDVGDFDATAILNRVARSIAKPMQASGFELTLHASIGLRKTARLTLSECLERADFALFQAKKSNDAVALFDEDHERRFLRKARVAADFKVADLNQALEIEYQPIYDFDSQKVVSVEALARWKRNASSVVMPHIFIELAESTGRISEITDRMIAKAIRDASVWPSEIGVQINLSTHDLSRERLADQVAEVIENERLSPHRVTFEVTESILVSNQTKAAGTIEKLRALGCKIALDDFGTGYSSLAYIDRFPIDQIKLDREFARKLAGKQPATIVASTIFSLSQQLGASCTIEGIETKEQALIARRLGIRRMQGFYFARPLRHGDLEKRFSGTWQPRSALEVIQSSAA